jgi:hypothetical protein
MQLWLHRHLMFNIKGIVSRDLHICFWYQSKDLKFLQHMEPLVCFSNFVFVKNFLNFASLRSETLQISRDYPFNVKHQKSTEPELHSIAALAKKNDAYLQHRFYF